MMSNLFHKEINGRQFNFQPLEFGQESGYSVDVKDEEGVRWEFRMLGDNDHEVKLEGENLPAWITDLEDDLLAAVKEHE